MANFSIEALEERIKALEDLKGIQESNDNSLNQFFLIVMGVLVMFMQSGFAFLEAGSVRQKNVVNILIKNILDCLKGAIIWWACGFAFAYGDLDTPSAANKFIGHKYFFTQGWEDFENFHANWFFQYVFAATAATIVSGAVAERTQFGSYVIYSTFITGFVYPVVAHWAWSSTGWLTSSSIPSFRRKVFDCESLSYKFDEDDVIAFADFAGSAVVHCTGGIAALMGAFFLGPRVGKYERVGGKRVSKQLAGHSVPLAALGGFILFVGFMAFNGGSALAIVSSGEIVDNGQAVASAIMNTLVGGASGAVFCLGLSILVPVIKGDDHYWSLLTTINGGLGGMASLCAGCNDMTTGAAFGIGGIAGMTVYWVGNALDRIGIDDPIDAFAVHFGGGVCGILLAPLFANFGIARQPNCGVQKEAFGEVWAACNVAEPVDMELFECDYYAYKQFAWNLIGLIVITLWSGTLVGGVFAVLKATKLLRVEEEIEIRGLDIKKHGEPGYPLAAQGHGWEERSSSEEKTKTYQKNTVIPEPTHVQLEPARFGPDN